MTTIDNNNNDSNNKKNNINTNSNNNYSCSTTVVVIVVVEVLVVAAGECVHYHQIYIAPPQNLAYFLSVSEAESYKWRIHNMPSIDLSLCANTRKKTSSTMDPQLVLPINLLILLFYRLFVLNLGCYFPTSIVFTYFLLSCQPIFAWTTTCCITFLFFAWS